jgi:hypothetical protein
MSPICRSVFFICAFLGAVATSSAATGNHFLRDHLPSGVRIGMSAEEVRRVRPEALRSELAAAAGRPLDRDEMVEFIRQQDTTVSYWYRFRAGRLGAVIRSTKTTYLPVEHVKDAVNKAASDLATHFVGKGQDRILKSYGMASAILTAELWHDLSTGLDVYFLGANHEISYVIFDPALFGKADFFADPAQLEKVQANSQRIARTFGASAPPPVAVIDLLAEARMGTAPPPGPAVPPTAGDNEPPTAKAASPAPITPVAQVPTTQVERRAPVWPWVAGGIVALLVVARLVLMRRTE